MATTKKFKSLSKDRQRLVLQMADIGHGSIVGLQVVAGEPDFTTSSTIYRRHHLTTRTERRVAKPRADFELNAPIIALFEIFDRYVNLEIEELKVEGGLPHALVTVGNAAV